jgi:secondary thiamine-phosphate synthase enzyme
MNTISVQTNAHDELIDISAQVQVLVSESKVNDGCCIVYTPHTTAGITINENADPDVRTDLLHGLRSLDFERLPFRHMEGNSPAHLKSSLIGCSETIIIAGGRLQLGTWQGIYFCEFDGPRKRKVHVNIIG